MSKKKNRFKDLDSKEKERLKKLEEKVKQEGLKREILQDIDSPLLCAAILERIPSICSDIFNNPDLIPFIEEAKKRFLQDKNVRKALKKLIFKLKNKGVDLIPLIEEREEVPVITPKIEKEIAYMAFIPGGFKILVFAVHMYSKTTFDLAIAFISVISEIKIFDLKRSINLRTTNKIKDYIENVFAKMIEEKMVEIPLSYGRHILEKAYKKRLKDSKDNDLRIFINWLRKNVPDLVKKPIYDLIPKPESISVSDLELEKIFSLDAIEDQIMLTIMALKDEQQVKELLEELNNIRNSPLVLEEYQIEERERELKERYIDKLLDPEILKEFFEDLSYYLYLVGQKEEAQIFLKLAYIFEEKGRNYKLISLKMLNKALEIMKSEEENESKGKLIKSVDEVIEEITRVEEL